MRHLTPVLLVLSACACATSTALRGSSTDITLDPASLIPDPALLASEPELRARLESDVHAYFRFINLPFSRQVCRLFRDRIDEMPRVTLHGDAHLEQYAVTDAGRGLTDFDDASTGPAIIDLVRFGVSLELGAKAHGWGEWRNPALREFLRGYRRTLEDPALEVREPVAAGRLRARFATSREGFLAWATDLIEPMTDDERQALEAALRSYFEAAQLYERVEAEFFRIKAAGPFRLGTGSALDAKYLLRVEGPTPEALDDVILEAKEIRSLAQIPCVAAGPKADPFRFLVGPAREPYLPYLGTFGLGERSFWVHAWIGNYQELKLGETLESPEELLQVAFEAGAQLARAHVEGLQASRDTALALREAESVARLEKDVRRTVEIMADATVAAWKSFRASPEGP